jgi:hypothetical protein
LLSTFVLTLYIFVVFSEEDPDYVIGNDE